jgi:antitoxin MazE
MKASLIKIGNSRGIRIPKPVFAACGFEDEVEMEVKDGDLVIRSANKAREGWGEAFQAMAQNGDDTLLDEAVPTQWEDTEWEWK